MFVATTLLAHETMYLGVHAFSVWAEATLGSCKIARKASQVPAQSLIRRALIKGLVSHALLQPPVLWLVHRYLFAFASRADSLALMAMHLAICQFSECFLFFASHRLLHSRALYPLHKVHHEFKGSVAIAAEYSHPVESLLGNYVPVALAPVLLGVSLEVWLTWLCWRLWATYERHSGFDFSRTFIGRLGLMHGHGARYHDNHHTLNNGNFGSGLDFFDVLCGTRVW